MSISGNYGYYGIVAIANQQTTGAYTIAGAAAASSTFGYNIYANQNLNLAQVAGGTLNIANYGISASGANSMTVNFVGPARSTSAGR